MTEKRKRADDTPVDEETGLQTDDVAASGTTCQYVDATRPTPPNGSFPGAPSRTLPTEIWYPATQAGRVDLQALEDRLGAEGIDPKAQVGSLSVADQRGFCMALMPGQTCPTTQPGFVDACNERPRRTGQPVLGLDRWRCYASPSRPGPAGRGLPHLERI